MRVCIFCGNKKTNKEHVWPQWMKAYLAFDDKSYATVKNDIYRDRIENEEEKRGGDFRGRPVSCVCVTCNGGWMSRLQNAVKKFAVPLITSQPLTLDFEAQRILAAWIAMFVCCSERRVPYASTTTKDDRTFLMEHAVAPLTWGIWIGHYVKSEDWRSQLKHFIGLVDPNADPNAVLDREHPRNLGVTTYHMGVLMVHVIACSEYPSEVPQEFDMTMRNKMLKIWPYQNDKVWGPPPVLTDLEAELVGNTFFEKFSGRRLFPLPGEVIGDPAGG